MKDLQEVRICTEYKLSNGQICKYMPDNIKELEGAQPIYKEFKGWGDISNVKTKSDLPNPLIDFLNFIKENTEFDISYIGNGRGKNSLIRL